MYLSLSSKRNRETPEYNDIRSLSCKGKMIMNAEQIRTWKEAVVAYLYAAGRN
jgi:hypothetical protein